MKGYFNIPRPPAHDRSRRLAAHRRHRHVDSDGAFWVIDRVKELIK